MGPEKNTKRKLPQGEKARQLQSIVDAMRAPKKSLPAIDVKAAVGRALAFFEDLFPKVYAVRLEEIDRQGDDWLVTIGYLETPPPSKLDALDPMARFREHGERVYKVMKVDAKTGEVHSMKIRKP